MKKIILVILIIASFIVFPCNAKSKTTVLSSDGSVKTDLIGTWVCISGDIQNTLTINSDGTFKIDENISYSGPEQRFLGTDGRLTTKKEVKAVGNWSIVGGSILHCEYICVWANVSTDLDRGKISNTVIHPISENEFLLGDSSIFRRK